MMTAQSPRRRLPDQIAEAIAVIIERFWEDQIKDFLAGDRETQRRHIFNEMLTVRQWLNRQDFKQRGFTDK